jgi:hypothetical protein
MSKTLTKPMIFKKWIMDRLTLLGLILLQPIFTTTILFQRPSEGTIKSLVGLCCFAVLALGLDAGLRIRRRRPAMKSLRTEHRSIFEDILDGAFGLISPLALIASIQMTFRKTFSIGTDLESLELLGYAPSNYIIDQLTFGTAVWALVSAYVIKYYWDDLMSLLESRQKP